MSLVNKDYYTADEYAAIKNVCLKAVYNWVRRGIGPLPVFENGRYWFPKAQADSWQPPKRGPKPKVTIVPPGRAHDLDAPRTARPKSKPKDQE